MKGEQGIVGGVEKIMPYNHVLAHQTEKSLSVINIMEHKDIICSALHIGVHKSLFSILVFIEA